jgi:FMN-dependent NADH-azoreductase
MTPAQQIFEKLQSKRKAVETITNWLATNPLASINEEMRASRTRKRQEIEELQKELEEIYNANYEQSI